MEFESVIGLEIHVQLNTLSKIFSSDPNTFGEEPNVNISPISSGYPGTLPKLNEEAVRKAVVMGIACSCNINREFSFSRKHYFYPDLPKGYQITQFDKSICMGGSINISVNGSIKSIGLEKIHLEEDAGKSMHDKSDAFSVVDLNRAGVPLIEIVTLPDMRSAEEAFVLLNEIRKLVRYYNISDGDMEKGSLRCDANVSLRLKGEKELGNKVEIKNLNSMRFVRNAIQLEIKRQKEILLNSGSISSHTRGYNDTSNSTFASRAKEMAHDYRYFPEPDLPPFHLSQEWIDNLKEEMSPLPGVVEESLVKEHKLKIEDASYLVGDEALLRYFYKACSFADSPAEVVKWILGPVKSFLNEKDLGSDEIPVLPEHLAGLTNLINSGKLSFSLASKKLFPEMIKQAGIPPEQLQEKLNVVITSDVSSIKQLVMEAVDKFPGKIAEFRNGKKGVVELYMGEVMKLSRGKADPAIAREIIIEVLNSKK